MSENPDKPPESTSEGAHGTGVKIALHASRHAALVLSGLTLMLIIAKVLFNTGFDKSTALLVMSVSNRVQLVATAVLDLSGTIALVVLGFSIPLSFIPASSLMRKVAPATAIIAALWILGTQPLTSLGVAAGSIVVDIFVLRRMGLLPTRRERLTKISSYYRRRAQGFKDDQLELSARVSELQTRYPASRERESGVLVSLSRWAISGTRKMVKKWYIRNPEIQRRNEFIKIRAELQKLSCDIAGMTEGRTSLTDEAEKIDRAARSRKMLLPEHLLERLLLILGVIVITFIPVSGSWVPSESIATGGFGRVDGYVVGESLGNILVLKYNNREPVWIPSSDVEHRRICYTKSEWLTLTLPDLLSRRAHPPCK